MAMVPVYTSDEEADLLKEYAQANHLTLSALFRGALKRLTNNYTDFSTAHEWADYRSRGRPPEKTASTGSEQNDASWHMIRRETSASVERLLGRINELQTENPGLSVVDAMNRIIQEDDMPSALPLELPIQTPPPPQAPAEGDALRREEQQGQIERAKACVYCGAEDTPLRFEDDETGWVCQDAEACAERTLQQA